MAANGEQEYLDNETGEKNQKSVCFRTVTTDAETGEPEIEKRFLRNQVPSGHLPQHQEKISRKSKQRRKIINGFYWRKQKIQSNIVKEFVIGKKQNVSPIVFMLPTFFICPAWASILCLLGEACMHIWSHKRHDFKTLVFGMATIKAITCTGIFIENWKKKNSNIEYRSPLHLISSQFCVHCRSQKWMEEISRIQDKRNFRRRILHPKF